MDKTALRKWLLEQRKALDPEERDRLSLLAQAHLMESAPFRKANLILLYQAFRGEVETGAIASAAVAHGKRLALPRVQKEPRKLWLHAFSGNLTSLMPGAYGIREPKPEWPIVAPGEVDLVVVPGVAFSPDGGRLGYGGGYYDRLLPELRAANPEVGLIGLAYSFQVLDQVPVDPHDIRVDGVVTENGYISR